MTQTCVSHPPVPVARRVDVGHPLGPLVRWTRLESPVGGRLYALGVLASASAIMVTAWRIHPGEHLMGTHQQLGLAPCGFLLITGLPCPTCGMTTAFAHTIHGELVGAIRSQLAGFFLAVGTLVAGMLGLVALLAGRRPALNWYRINPVHAVWWGAAFFVLAWGLKMGLGLLSGSLPYRDG